MNAERRHALLHIVGDDLDETELHTRMQQLSVALQTQIQSPHAQHQTKVGEALKAVYSAIDKSRINELSPAWMQMLEVIGYDDCLGITLKARVEEVFKGSELTPTLAKEEIDELAKRLKQLCKATSDGISAFEVLSIGAEELPAGSCELGFMVPKEAIDSKLEVFAKECKDFDFIFGTFSEVATGKRHHYEIRTISSSDFSVFLLALPAVAALIAKTAERLLAAYKQLLEIRKLRAGLQQQKVPEKALAELDTHANTHMEREIEIIAVDVMKQNNSHHDAGRSNELLTAVKVSLSKLANRIDRGYHVEVRIAALPPADSEEKKPSREEKELAKHAQTIQAAAKQLQFINLEGKPILSLSEGESRKPTKARKAKSKKKTAQGKED